jgi:hypothetical protein
MAQKLIVRFIKGEEKHGGALTFSATMPTFYLHAEEESGNVETFLVKIDEVKAILFLKEDKLPEIRLHTQTIIPAMLAGPVAFHLTVEFHDGEIMYGTTLRYDPREKNFFIVPLHLGDAIERVFINAKATKQVDCKRFFGSLLVDQGKITADQLDMALNFQREEREKKIGTILQEQGLISEAQMEESLRKQQKMKHKMLGEILIECGHITSEQLQAALEEQKKKREKRLGQILIDLKYVTQDDISNALSLNWSSHEKSSAG